MDIKTPQDLPNEHVLDTAARMAGGRSVLADRLGVSTAAIGNWKLRGATPIEHCPGIEVATAGAVTRRDLRPDDWKKIWPELEIPSVERSCCATESVVTSEGA